MIRWLRSALFLTFGGLTGVVATTLMMLLFWAPRAWPWWINVQYCSMILWAGGFFCGMKVVIEGEEHIPDEPCVVMIKHTSTLETYGHVPMFPRTSWVVKRELVWAPFFGWSMGLLFQPIAIERSAGTSSIKQVIRQGKERLANGVWVTIFPEGTRVPPGETRKYGVSGAALAKEANVLILPVAHNAGDYWRRKEFVKRPGIVRFCIGPPISAQDRAPKETNLVVQDWIETKMGEISSEYQKRG
jgi:1-acyl-sn-glycerol-3-phosphate acyltransferase